MLERGLAGFDLTEVARSSRLTRQTDYNHFDSRAALLVALVDHVYETDRSAAQMDQFRNETTPVGMLRMAARITSDYAPKIYYWARVLYATRLEDPAAETPWKYRMTQRLATAEAFIARLTESGRLSTDWSKGEARDVTFMLLSLHTYEYLVVESGWSLAKYLRLLGRLLERALLDA
jgi:AcrR family transcriptional regulator